MLLARGGSGARVTAAQSLVGPTIATAFEREERGERGERREERGERREARGERREARGERRERRERREEREERGERRERGALGCDVVCLRKQRRPRSPTYLVAQT
jgi:hypothetical protein